MLQQDYGKVSGLAGAGWRDERRGLNGIGLLRGKGTNRRRTLLHVKELCDD